MKVEKKYFEGAKQPITIETLRKIWNYGTEYSLASIKLSVEALSESIKQVLGEKIEFEF